MNNYKEFTSFLKEVENNNIISIRNEISNMIILLEGDRDKIYEAIEYAKDKSDFKFDKHIEEGNLNKKDPFTFENGVLRSNFSKERLDLVLQLYKPYALQHDQSKENASHNTTNNKKDINTENSKKKGIVIVGVIIVSAYILFEILK